MCAKNKFSKMVKEVKKSDKVYYQCEECEFYYKDKKWAKKCENFCRKNKSCSIEITKNAVSPKQEK